MLTRFDGPSPITNRTLAQELTRTHHWLPLLLTVLIFTTILWDQAKWRLSLFSPFLFFQTTILLPVPGVVNVVWMVALTWWGYYDSYKQLVLLGVFQILLYVFIMPFRDAIRAAVLGEIPNLPYKSWSIAGHIGAAIETGFGRAVGAVMRVNPIMRHAYEKAKEDPEGSKDRPQFVMDRLNSLTRSSTAVVMSTVASFARGPSSDSDTAVPEDVPVPKKRGRPVGSRNKKRDIADISPSSSPPPADARPAKRAASRAPSIPPDDITPERRYLRANRQADITAGKNPEPYLDLDAVDWPAAIVQPAEGAVKPEEDEYTPTKPKRAKKVQILDAEDAGALKARRKRAVS